jgi:hypothetical protein
MGQPNNNFTSPQPGLLNTSINNIQSNAKGRVSQMLSPLIINGQTTGQVVSGTPLLNAFGFNANLTLNPTQITTLTADANQNIVIVLPDGTKINMTLNYFAGQQGWFYSFNYNNSQFVVNNRRLITGPNMLSQFQNIIEFGFAVTTTDGYEPVFIDDFISGRASFFVLTQLDIATLVEAVINAV